MRDTETKNPDMTPAARAQRQARRLTRSAPFIATRLGWYAGECLDVAAIMGDDQARAETARAVELYTRAYGWRVAVERAQAHLLDLPLV